MQVIVTIVIVSWDSYNLFTGRIQPTFIGVNGHPLILSTSRTSQFTKSFRYPKCRYQVPYKAILVVGFPLHKPYPYSLYRCGECLYFRYLSEMFGDQVGNQKPQPLNSSQLPSSYRSVLRSRLVHQDTRLRSDQESRSWLIQK